MKEKADTVEKYSITDIEPLINDILSKHTGKTEQWICEVLGYNDGYISQMRSREKKDGKPQVPVRVYNQLKNFKLHFAIYNADKVNNGEVDLKEPQVKYESIKRDSAEYLAGRLEGKEDEIKQIEARRRDMELRAEQAEKEKDRYLKIIEENLTQLLKVTLGITSNLGEVKKDTTLGLSYQRAWVEYTAEEAAQGDKKKKDQTVMRMNKLLRSQIDRDQKAGKSTDAHKQSKDGN